MHQTTSGQEPGCLPEKCVWETSGGICLNKSRAVMHVHTREWSGDAHSYAITVLIHGGFYLINIVRMYRYLGV